MKNQPLQQLILLHIQLIVWLGASYIVNKSWFGNKIIEIIVYVIAYILFLLVPYCSFLFRPVRVKISQESCLSKNVNEIHILIEKDELKTPQTQRTINLTIELKRRGSLWWRVLHSFLRTKDVCLHITTIPESLYLQPINFTQIEEINLLEAGFSIHLNHILNDLDNRIGTFSISKSYPFFISDHPDIHIPQNLNAVIQPCLMIENKASWLFRSLLGYETNHQQIAFFRR